MVCSSHREVGLPRLKQSTLSGNSQTKKSKSAVGFEHRAGSTASPTAVGYLDIPCATCGVYIPA